MNSVVSKLGLSIVTLFLIVLFPIGFAVDKAFSNYYYQQEFLNLSGQGEKLVSFLQSGENSLEAAKSVVIGMEMTSSHVFILDASRRIVSQSTPAQELGGFLSNEDWSVLSKGSSIGRSLISTKEGFILFAAPVMKNNLFLGAVVIEKPAGGLLAALSSIKGILLLSGLGAILTIMGFTIVLARKLSNPLLEMERATLKIAKGDLDVRLRRSSNDELGSLTDAINNLASELKRYRDTRAEFFSNISHELRTPLTYIEGYTRLLGDTIYDPEQFNRINKILSQETRRLKTLVNDLFDLAQLEEGKVSLTLEWIDLTEVIEIAIDKFSERAKEKGIRLEFQEGSAPLLLLDGNRMQQVLINLLDNAVRYTSNGTTTVRMENLQDHVLVSVEDTGSGIPTEELDFIFERFHRVEKSRSREHGGTGLGLAIVKKLVKLQNGTIQVKSELGSGTRFMIAFPILEGDQNEKA